MMIWVLAQSPFSNGNSMFPKMLASTDESTQHHNTEDHHSHHHENIKSHIIYYVRVHNLPFNLR